MFDYYYLIIMAHMEKKTEKKSIVTKTTLCHLPENDNSYVDTMTGT